MLSFQNNKISSNPWDPSKPLIPPNPWDPSKPLGSLQTLIPPNSWIPLNPWDPSKPRDPSRPLGSLQPPGIPPTPCDPSKPRDPYKILLYLECTCSWFTDEMRGSNQFKFSNIRATKYNLWTLGYYILARKHPGFKIKHFSKGKI